MAITKFSSPLPSLYLGYRYESMTLLSKLPNLGSLSRFSEMLTGVGCYKTLTPCQGLDKFRKILIVKNLSYFSIESDFLRAGQVSPRNIQQQVRDMSANANYWSPVTQSKNNSSSLVFGPSNIYSSDTNSRLYGFSLRCLLLG